MHEAAERREYMEAALLQDKLTKHMAAAAKRQDDHTPANQDKLTQHMAAAAKRQDDHTPAIEVPPTRKERQSDKSGMEVLESIAWQAGLDTTKVTCKTCGEVECRYKLSSSGRRCWRCQGYASESEHVSDQMKAIECHAAQVRLREDLWRLAQHSVGQ